VSAATGTKAIDVRTFKFDGTLHRQWSARIQRREGSLIVLEGEFDSAIEHDLLGTISCGTISTEYYWLDRWYNIFRFSSPDGCLLSYYCNINQPPVFDGKILRYVDLDIDLLVSTDLTFRVLDLEDFEVNAVLYQYPRELREHVDSAVNELIGLIEHRAFPFNE